MCYEDDGGFTRRETQTDSCFEVENECAIGCGAEVSEGFVLLHGEKFCSQKCASQLYQPVYVAVKNRTPGGVYSPNE